MALAKLFGDVDPRRGLNKFDARRVERAMQKNGWLPQAAAGTKFTLRRFAAASAKFPEEIVHVV